MTAACPAGGELGLGAEPGLPAGLGRLRRAVARPVGGVAVPAVAPADADPGFADPGFDDSGWATLPVPSHWQLNGYGAPAYTNVLYLFPTRRTSPPRTRPAITGSASGCRPTGTPSGPLLRFEGADSFRGCG